MIEAIGVSLKYADDTLALKDFDLQIKAGEMLFVTGPSGSGKTSFLKLLMGIEFPTTGSLQVFGQPMAARFPAEIRQLRRSIGPVFQDFRLLKGRTAMDNVILGMRFLDMPKSQLKENAANALTKVGLAKKTFSLVENLSLGEQQRVAIARAVARQPRLILADEPTGNLDKENALHIMELLASFKDQKTTVIVSTHATQLISSGNSTSLIIINQGSLQRER